MKMMVRLLRVSLGLILAVTVTSPVLAAAHFHSVVLDPAGNGLQRLLGLDSVGRQPRDDARRSSVEGVGVRAFDLVGDVGVGRADLGWGAVRVDGRERDGRGDGGRGGGAVVQGLCRGAAGQHLVPGGAGRQARRLRSRSRSRGPQPRLQLRRRRTQRPGQPRLRLQPDLEPRRGRRLLRPGRPARARPRPGRHPVDRPGDRRQARGGGRRLLDSPGTRRSYP